MLRNSRTLFKAMGAGVAICISVILIVMYLVPAKLLTQEHPSSGFRNQLRTETKQDMNKLAARYPSIAVVALIGLDFQHNVRVPVYDTIPNLAVAERMKRYAGTGGVAPIFSDNKMQNQEMTDLVNAHFKCNDSDQGVFAQLYHVQDLLETSCRMPMAPSVGRLVGYFVVHMTSQPTPEQLVNLEQDMKTLAVGVYFNEFVPFQPHRED